MKDKNLNLNTASGTKLAKAEMTKREYHYFIVMLAMMSIVGLVSSDIYLPAFPLMAEFFQVDAHAIQSTLSVYLLGLSVSQIFYGSLADRYGRRPVLLIGIGLYILGCFSCALATDLTTLLICRFIQAIGACSGMVISRAVVSDLFKKEDSARIFASIFPIIGMSPALSPLIGGFLTSYLGWRSNFYFVGIFGIFLIAMLITFLKETLHPDKRLEISMSGLISNYGKILQNPLYLAYTIIVCSAYSAYFAYLAGSPFVFNELGYLPEQTGFFYIALALSYVAGNLTGKKYIKTHAIDRAISVGMVAFVFGGFLMFFFGIKGVSSPLEIIIPMTILTFGNGFLLPLGVGSVVTIFPEMAGTASGLMGLIQLGSASIATISVGKLFASHVTSMTSVIFLANLVGIIAMLFVYHIKGKQSQINLRQV
jgi:DHA1 family bicyclomycin/chloramphenicol resistance-like MFS transporter